MKGEGTSGQGEAPVRIPITGELDLHTFSPRDLEPLLDAYLDECRLKGIFSVRIIHGKGTGALRERVQAYARRKKEVLGYRLGDEKSGGWGATILQLASLESGNQKLGKIENP
jgi:dsDNA-specific endonuclease/ATPase MutS2